MTKGRLRFASTRVPRSSEREGLGEAAGVVVDAAGPGRSERRDFMRHTLGVVPDGSVVAMTDAADPTATLRRLRGSIDNIDAALIHMLAERFKATQQVGVLKAEHGMPASDPAREEQQIARLRRLASDADLDPEFAEKWFNFVVAEVIRHHTAAAEGA